MIFKKFWAEKKLYSGATYRVSQDTQFLHFVLTWLTLYILENTELLIWNEYWWYSLVCYDRPCTNIVAILYKNGISTKNKIPFLLTFKNSKTNKTALARIKVNFGLTRPVVVLNQFHMYDVSLSYCICKVQLNFKNCFW